MQDLTPTPAPPASISAGVPLSLHRSRNSKPAAVLVPLGPIVLSHCRACAYVVVQWCWDTRGFRNYGAIVKGLRRTFAFRETAFAGVSDAGVAGRERSAGQRLGFQTSKHQSILILRSHLNGAEIKEEKE
jgi:hypothetical protein